MSELDRLGCGMDYTWIIILMVAFFLLYSCNGGTGCNSLQNIVSDFKCCFSGCGSNYLIWIVALFFIFYYSSYFC